MLKRRHITNAAQGPKAAKIERLKLNDRMDRDTANYKDTMLYVRTELSGDRLEELVAKQEAMLAGEDQSHSNRSLGKLRALLEDRKLSCSGNKEVMISRLLSNDRKKLAKDIIATKKEYKSLKQQLEFQIGHPVEVKKVFLKEKELEAVDNRIHAKAKMNQPGMPICDYDWRESHWASRTERELSEICRRREMPGYGPKAAMIKWLETGSVDYEDLYVTSLEIFCMKRGIKHKELC
jgi:hypothetical protein